MCTRPVPFRGRRLERWQRRHDSTHAKIRCLREQAVTTPKGWWLLRKLRCSTTRITAIVQPVLVLHHASARGGKRLTVVTGTGGAFFDGWLSGIFSDRPWKFTSRPHSLGWAAGGASVLLVGHCPAFGHPWNRSGYGPAPGCPRCSRVASLPQHRQLPPRSPTLLRSPSGSPKTARPTAL